MRGGLLRTGGVALAVAGLLVLALAAGSARGDDSGFLGRLFRWGGGFSSSGSSRAAATSNQPAPLPYGGLDGSAGSFLPAAPTGPRSPNATPALGPLPEGPSTPDLSAAEGTPPRVLPRPRVSNAVTTADPLLTRTALGRSRDGSQFGMCLQIFTDGTVIDSEGVHRLPPSDLKPIVEVIQSGALNRLRGHCGTPAPDFVEYVHIVVFERWLGRLQAHSFSYAGNPQGCDHAVGHLHEALEALQAKLSHQAGMTAPAPALPAGTTPGSPLAPRPLMGPAPTTRAIPPLPDAGASSPSGPVIPLTPLGPP